LYQYYTIVVSTALSRRQNHSRCATFVLPYYWLIRAWIRRDILSEVRSEYGDRIISTLSRQLAAHAPMPGSSAARVYGCAAADGMVSCSIT